MRMQPHVERWRLSVGRWTFALCLFSALILHLSSFGATNTWTGDLDLGPDGVLVGDANDLFRVGGSFNNQSTNTAYNILAATFEFTGSGPHNLEQAGRDLGPCAGNISNNWAFGTLKTAGTVTIVDNFPNSAGNDAVYVQALTSSGTLNVGDGTVFYFGSTNGWSGTVNVTGTGVFRSYLPDAADTDGDGMPNWVECRCGTDPTNSASVFRITNIQRGGNDIRVTWTTAGGRTNAVQATMGDGVGGYSTNFTGLSGLIIIPGSGDTTTNYLDVNGATNVPARYYRIRLVP